MAMPAGGVVHVPIAAVEFAMNRVTVLVQKVPADPPPTEGGGPKESWSTT